MKKQIFKAAAIAVATVVTFASCSSSDDSGSSRPAITADLMGSTSANVTIAAGETKTIYGEYRVQDGATLTIGAGATIKALKGYDIPTYILVEQGGKIVVDGTSANPVVMTSEPGSTWGGLHICGKATTNADAGSLSEIGEAPYGGSAPADNSGSLKYLIIENSGYALNADTEANGLTLYGVGSGTTIENILVYNGTDDGVEWFGGTVTAKNLVVINCSDDSFDWTYGWTSTGNENWIALHTGTYAGDCLIEADGGPSSDTAGASNPEIESILLIGNDNGSKNTGINLKKGTFGKLSTVIVAGKTNGIKMETAETDAAFLAGTATLYDISLSGAFTNTLDAAATYTETEFVADGNTANDTSATTDAQDALADAKSSWASWIDAKYFAE